MRLTQICLLRVSVLFSGAYNAVDVWNDDEDDFMAYVIVSMKSGELN